MSQSFSPITQRSPMKHFILLLTTIFMTGMANAQRYEIGNAVNTVKLNSSNINDSFVLEGKVAIPVYTIESYYDVENRTCTRVECEEREVNENPTWNGFFTSTNNAEKAKILSDMVKGIGISTAEKIVAYNLIKYRPTSWSSFVNLVNYLENELLKRGYQNKFAKEVIELYGFDNAKSLGYFLDTFCRDISYSCQITVLKEKKVFAYNINKNISINYSGKGSNTHLYPFEAEEITITTEGSGESKVLNKTGFNNYTSEVQLLDQGAKILVNIQAVSRNVIQAPSGMFNVSTQFNTTGAELKISTLGTYVSFLGQANNVEVTYQVCAQKGRSWSKSACKSPVNSGSFKLTETDKGLNIPFSYSSGAKYYVVYSVNLISSIDFKLGTLTQGASNTYKAP